MTDRGPASEVEIAALASSVRLRIIRLAHTEALSNAEVAQRLGRDPATTLHHVRRLVAHGFLEAGPSRRGARGAREIPYRSTGLSWSLEHPGRDPGVAEAGLEAFLGEVADVGVSALDQTRLVLRLRAADADALRGELDALLRRYATRPPDPEGDELAVYLAVYPGSTLSGANEADTAPTTWEHGGQHD